MGDTPSAKPYRACQLPQGDAFAEKENFPATAKAVPLGKVAKPQALTEGVNHGSKLPH